MSRPLRTVLAAVLVALAAVGVLGLLPQLTLTFSLPTRHPTGVSEHNQIFPPAVTAAVVAGVILVLLIVHLVRVAQRARGLAEWIVAAVLALIAFALPFVVSGLLRPVF